MATIDPSIAMGYRPIQIENPINQLAAYSQIQGAQQGQQLNALKIREAEQSMENRSNIRNIPGSINDPDYISKVAKYDPELAVKLQKDLAAFKTSGLQTIKLESEIVDNKLKQSRQFLDTIDPADPSAPARYLAWHEANHKDPVLGPMLIARGVTVDQSRANIDNAIRQGPQAFATLLNQSKIGVEKFAELNKPTIQNITRGGISEQIQTPGMGGLPVVTRTAQVTATPGELLVDKRTREAVDRGERRDIVASTSTAADGTVTQFNKFGEVINRITAAGKPSATFEKTTALKKQLNTDLTTTIKELERVTADKGLIDQSTGSGAGRLADIGVGFFGGATEGAIATAKLKPIADMVLKMVPRFEGPQSDKDTASYKEAAGQLADPTVPNKIRKEAAIEIIRLMKNRKNQFVSDVMATEGMSAGAPPLPAGFTADKP